MSKHGYSGTPLARKLGLKTSYLVYVCGMDEDAYQALFSDLPESLEWTVAPTDESLDFAHLFVQTHADLNVESDRLIPLLKKDGMLWVSWPKGTSKLYTEINRENVRAALLSRGLVDTKVCAVNEDWSGLKFVYRTEDR